LAPPNQNQQNDYPYFNQAENFADSTSHLNTYGYQQNSLYDISNPNKQVPEYFKNHPIYYAGPAKTPDGMPSGSFGPTTAGRMDVYVEEFQKGKNNG
jgi:hypothetical protein